MPEHPQSSYTTFWLFRVTDRLYEWTEAERRQACNAALDMLVNHGSTVHLRGAYSTAGLSAGVDLILWVVAGDPEAFQRLAADLRRPPVGGALELRHAYLGVGSASQYDPDHGPAFLRGLPPKRYLSVYPFSKTPAWYLLPFEQRRDLMVEHGKLGAEFTSILTNTVSSFGIADQEFVVALEDDDPAVLVKMVQRLRAAKVREYTQVDTPIFLGLRKELDAAMEDAMALPNSRQTAEFVAQGTAVS
ncbi:MAG TPA: chlorite dismutase family protein [Thermomicrobiales bacterium]